MVFETKQWIIAQVTRMYLSGLTQEEISRQLKVSEGTVNSIIQDVSKSDNSFLLQHEVAFICKKEGIPIKQLGSNLKYENAIKRRGFEKNKTESFLWALNSTFTEDSSISPELAAKLVYQVCNMILKYNVGPYKLAEQLQSKYRELDDIEEKINENKKQLSKSEYKVNVTLQKNNFTLKQVEQFANTKKELKRLGIDIGKLDHIVNIHSNIRDSGGSPKRIISEMKKYGSIRNEKARLQQELEVYEAILKVYRKELEKEWEQWRSLYASRTALYELLSMGLTPDHICKIHEIVLRHSPSLSPDELVNDIDTNGGIKSPISRTMKPHKIKSELSDEFSNTR